MYTRKLVKSEQRWCLNQSSISKDGKKVDEFELHLEVYVRINKKEELWQLLGLGLEQPVGKQ